MQSCVPPARNDTSMTRRIDVEERKPDDRHRPGNGGLTSTFDVDVIPGRIADIFGYDLDTG